MIRVLNYRNAKCIKCGYIEKHMLQVGAFVMCRDCYSNEFGQIDGITLQSKEHETYKKWLKIYMEDE